MRITRLTFVAFQLNGAVDSGNYPDLTIGVIQKHLDDETILPFLEERLGSDLDLSLLTPGERMELTADWLDMYLAIDAPRKLCVEKHGLTLLVAFVLESIQRAYVQIVEQRRAAGLPIFEDLFSGLETIE